MKNFIGKSWNEMAGGAKVAAAKRTSKFIVFDLAAALAMIAR